MVTARDERGCALRFYAEPDKKLRKLASFTAFVRLLDGPPAALSPVRRNGLVTPPTGMALDALLGMRTSALKGW